MKTLIKNTLLIALLSSLLTVTTYAADKAITDKETTTDKTTTTDTATTDTKSTDKSKATTTSTGNSSFVGEFQCKSTGTNSNSITPLNIKHNGGTYTFQWVNSSGYPTLFGTGVMHPDDKTLMSVAFLDPKKPDVFGVELFSLQKDGSLVSTWALQSSNKVGTEVCTRSK